ncbi:MAG: TonB-dependent receptor [Bacteroidetes bacterium]|nr:TonB-dependent receptor [Bacteroidota bacterium]
MRTLQKIAFIILLFSIGVSANPMMGMIKGKVINIATKQPVPFATVVVLGTQKGATSNEDGTFSIDGLTPNVYQVRVSAIGYATITVADVVVNNTKPTEIQIELQETSLQLKDVTITSDYFYTPPTDLNSTTTFSYEELRRAPGGFEDVVRALSILPGVAQASAGRNDLLVRGGAPSENLYILDGIKIPNINHFGAQGATGGPLSFVNLDFVKESVFSTGGFSSLYGDKLSSVLKIDLRDGRSDKIGGKATISASQFGLNLEGPLSESSNFIFSARRSYLDFIFKAAGFGFVPEYYDVLAKYDVNINNKQKISYLFIGAFDNVKFFNDTEDQRYNNSRILGSDQTQYGTGITFTNLMDKGYYKVVMSRNYVDYDSQQSDSLLNPIFRNISREAENKLRFEFFHQFSKITELTAGLQGEYITTSFDIKLPKFKTSFGEILPVDSVKTSKNFYKYSAFANVTHRFTAGLLLNAGFRLDEFSGISNGLRLSPRFSIEYKFNPETGISFSTGVYHQSPSYIWLVADARNTDLRPIRVDQYVLGIEHRVSEDALLKLEGFYKNYKDYPTSLARPYVVLSNTGAGFEGSDNNFESFGFEPLTSSGVGNAKGIEFSAQKKLSEIPLYGLLSLTYSEIENTAFDGVPRQGKFNQKWLFNLSGGYRFDESWEASFKFRYSSGAPYTPFNPDGTQSLSNYNSAKLPDAHALDVRVDKKWFFESVTLITYIDIENIYNKKNVFAYRWDRREKKEDGGGTIGILPSIGVSLEF